MRRWYHPARAIRPDNLGYHGLALPVGAVGVRTSRGNANSNHSAHADANTGADINARDCSAGAHSHASANANRHGGARSFRRWNFRRRRRQ